MSQTATAQRILPQWEPDTLLPSQLHTNHGRNHRPELHLVSAIFEDALHSVLANADARRGRKRREFLSACDWFWSTDRAWPFAFANICDLLGIDSGAVRSMLRSHIINQRTVPQRVPSTRHWSRRMQRRSLADGRLTAAERLAITQWDEV